MAFCSKAKREAQSPPCIPGWTQGQLSALPVPQTQAVPSPKSWGSSRRDKAGCPGDEEPGIYFEAAAGTLSKFRPQEEGHPAAC